MYLINLFAIVIIMLEKQLSDYLPKNRIIITAHYTGDTFNNF